MKMVNTQEEYMIAHITEQLNKLNYYDTDDKSLYRLNNILTRLRFNEINHDSSDNAWFV